MSLLRGVTIVPGESGKVVPSDSCTVRDEGEVSGLLSSVSGYHSCKSSSVLVPRFKPSSVRVGVPDMIQRRSALSLAQTVLKRVSGAPCTWPSSTTSRFQRTCASADIPLGGRQVQIGARDAPVGEGQVHNFHVWSLSRSKPAFSLARPVFGSEK